MLKALKRVGSAERFAEMITLMAFPYRYSDGCEELEGVPFIQKLSPACLPGNEKSGQCRFFCYVNQFSIECWGEGEYWVFKPEWHCCEYSDKVEHERAIETLSRGIITFEEKSDG